MDITELLTFTVQQGGSDLHLSSGDAPMIRLHGKLRRLKMPPLERNAIRQLIYDIMSDEQRKKFEENWELDFSVDMSGISRFRVNAFYQHKGEGAVFRVIPSEIISFQKLGLPQKIMDLCRKEKGLVVVTGPTGSGKSTTLAAMVNLLNEERNGHIITVEDPIEFVHQSKKCLVNQREVGNNTKSFGNALKSALREDPDIILVGEMRDLETISLALTAAETGHLVFGTLHTNSAAKTVDRIIDVFPANQQEQIRTMLSESLQGVISQALLPRQDGKGRVAAFEIMVGTSAVKNLIRENKTFQINSAIQVGFQKGMQSLDQHLKELLMKGLISPQEAAKKALQPETFLPGGTEGGVHHMHEADISDISHIEIGTHVR